MSPIYPIQIVKEISIYDNKYEPCSSFTNSNIQVMHTHDMDKIIELHTSSKTLNPTETIHKKDHQITMFINKLSNQNSSLDPKHLVQINKKSGWNTTTKIT
jgi:hypothetical protein